MNVVWLDGERLLVLGRRVLVVAEWLTPASLLLRTCLLLDGGEGARVAGDRCATWGATWGSCGGHSHLFTVLVEQAELGNIVAPVPEADLLGCPTQPVACRCSSWLLLEAEEVVSSAGSLREVVRELSLFSSLKLHHDWSSTSG